MRVRIAAAARLVALAVAPSVGALGMTCRLIGQVTDSTGGVLPGVSVTLANARTGVTYHTVTTGAGAYAFEAIPSGTSRVTCEFQ